MRLSSLKLILLFFAVVYFDKTTLGQSFTDPRDNHSYKTVKIGKQVWMAENLAYLPKINSPNEGSDEEALTKPFFYVCGYYGNQLDSAKKTKAYKTYGVLYNWVAAKAACPPGWHLPTDSEWKELETYMGLKSDESNQMMFRNSGNVGAKIKSKNIWHKPGLDEFQFAALPGGFRYGSNPSVKNKGDFGYLSEQGFFWTATATREGFAIRRQVVEESNGIVRFPQMTSHGYSVRCIKD